MEKTIKPMDEKILEKYKKEICIAESDLLKTLDYKFNIPIPTQQSFMDKVFIYFPADLKGKSENPNP